ncbi:MAG: DNA-directed RNA polymerase subunit omega [Ignavibacteriae bacterium HGW-Ignavibacteriae-2]|jgi:DNA-directed RNA polymerase subunit K/omega|nr:DNA-directed RNA polymerase subunit omega [Bacteroidota bacterium]PKL90324.1 MAG: DNA-directed RNA polymerase subunit omega [Ignavibacteriae bacterium HGW-Ignavibacteriae-2]
MNINPVDLKNIDSKTNNIYEAVIIVSKRARQINDEYRLEYNTAVNNLVTGPEDEFDDRVNPDLIKISVEIEARPKPHQTALNELITDGIEYRYKDEEKI